MSWDLPAMFVPEPSTASVRKPELPEKSASRWTHQLCTVEAGQVEQAWLPPSPNTMLF